MQKSISHALVTCKLWARSFWKKYFMHTILFLFEQKKQWYCEMLLQFKLNLKLWKIEIQFTDIPLWLWLQFQNNWCEPRSTNLRSKLSVLSTAEQEPGILYQSQSNIWGWKSIWEKPAIPGLEFDKVTDVFVVWRKRAKTLLHTLEKFYLLADTWTCRELPLSWWLSAPGYHSLTASLI